MNAAPPHLAVLRLMNHHKSASLSELGKSFSNAELRTYLTIALTYKSEARLQELFLRGYLSHFIHGKNLTVCDETFPTSFFSRKNSAAHTECKINASNKYQTTVDHIHNCIWKERTKFLKSGFASLADPVKGFKQLSVEDHDRVKYNIDLLEYQAQNDAEQYIKLLAVRVPYVSIFCALDNDKIFQLLAQLSRRELIIVATILNSLTLSNYTGGFFKRSGHLSFIMSTIQFIKNVLSSSVTSSTVMKGFRQMAKSASFSLLDVDVIQVLYQLCTPEYQTVLNRLSKLKRGGAESNSISESNSKTLFRWKMFGYVIMFFFSSLLGTIVTLIVAPPSIIYDAVKFMLVRKKMYGDDDEDHLQRGLDMVFMSMINRHIKIIGWAPEKFMKLVGYPAPEFNKQIVYNKPPLVVRSPKLELKSPNGDSVKKSTDSSKVEKVSITKA